MEASKPFSRAFATSPDEEIVISGIAGRFPKSNDLSAFAENLYNKVDIDFAKQLNYKYYTKTLINTNPMIVKFIEIHKIVKIY
jgi:hypothetical protein